MAANPREAERALPSIEREAECRHMILARRMIAARNAARCDAARSDWTQALEWLVAQAAELAALRADNERLREERNRAHLEAKREYEPRIRELEALCGSLMYGDDGRAPVSRIDPEVL